MVKGFFQKTKKHIENVLKIKETPHSIATGFTVGTVIAVLPTFGLGVIIGLGIVLIFKKLSKVSMLAAFAVWNAAILAPLYTLSYAIGDFWYKNSTNLKFEFNEEIYIYSIKFLFGNLIVVTIVGILSYIIIYNIAKKYQNQYKKYIAKPLEEHVVEPIEEHVIEPIEDVFTLLPTQKTNKQKINQKQKNSLKKSSHKHH